MSFSYEPLTDEEIEARSRFFIAEPVKFIIKNSYDQISSKGNPMKVLELELTDINNSKRDTKVYISNTYWKLIKEVLASINKSHLYKGDLPDDQMINSTGMAIAIEEPYVNKKGENAISIKVDKFLPWSAQNQEDPFKDDDIKF